MKKRIEQLLRDGFLGAEIEVIDDSARHIGHAGAQPGGETHFKVTVISPLFDGKSRVQRHRMVFSVLEEPLQGQVHALNIQALTPNE